MVRNYVLRTVKTFSGVSFRINQKLFLRVLFLSARSELIYIIENIIQKHLYKKYLLKNNFAGDDVATANQFVNISIVRLTVMKG